MTRRLNLNFSSVSGFKKAIFDKVEKLLVLLLAFPFFCPPYLISTSETFKLIVYYLRFISLFIIVTRLFVLNAKLNTTCVLAIIMQLLVLSITFLKNQVEFNSYFMQMASGIAVFLLIPSFEKKSGSLIGGLLLLFEICIYLNLFFLLFNILPYSYTNLRFLGTENTLVLYYLPGLLLSFINYYRNHNILRLLLFSTAVVASALLTWVATTMVSIFGAFIIVVLFHNKKRTIKTRTLWIITIAISFVLVFFYKSLMNTPLYEWFTTIVLKKDVTLSDRYSVWSIAIGMIKESPFLGHGYNAILHGTVGFNSHAHNLYLELFIVGGVCYFLLFVSVVYLSARAIDKHSNKGFALLFTSIMFATFITFITESYSEIWRFFLIFALASSIKELDKAK